MPQCVRRRDPTYCRLACLLRAERRLRSVTISQPLINTRQRCVFQSRCFSFQLFIARLESPTDGSVAQAAVFIQETCCFQRHFSDQRLINLVGNLRHEKLPQSIRSSPFRYRRIAQTFVEKIKNFVSIFCSLPTRVVPRRVLKSDFADASQRSAANFMIVKCQAQISFSPQIKKS